MSTNKDYEIEKVGVFTPKSKEVDELNAGEIGFIVLELRAYRNKSRGYYMELTACIKKPLPGFKPSKPVVFCGLFPVDSSEYQKLKDGLAKLKVKRL